MKKKSLNIDLSQIYTHGKLITKRERELERERKRERERERQTDRQTENGSKVRRWC